MAAAEAAFAEALALFRALGVQRGVRLSLAGLARVAAARGARPRAGAPGGAPPARFRICGSLIVAVAAEDGSDETAARPAAPGHAPLAPAPESRAPAHDSLRRAARARGRRPTGARGHWR